MVRRRISRACDIYVEREEAMLSSNTIFGGFSPRSGMSMVWVVYTSIYTTSEEKRVFFPLIACVGRNPNACGGRGIVFQTRGEEGSAVILPSNIPLP